MSTAQLPPVIDDVGSLFLYAGAIVMFVSAIATAIILAVRLIVKPELDKIHARIDEHMGEEEAALERVALAVETIADKVHVRVPPVIVRGGTD